MKFIFDIQLFGGGSSSTTSREIPAQGANEAALENLLMNYATSGLSGSAGLIQSGLNGLGSVFNPNWGEFYQNYVDTNDRAYGSYLGNMRNLNGYLSDSMRDNLNSYQFTMDDALNSYKSSLDNRMGIYDTNMRKYLDEDRAYQAAAIDEYSGLMGDAYNTWKGVTDETNPLYMKLIRGELPEAYATNRQKALNADLSQTVGAAINKLGNRGVVNSSVSNRALNNVSQNASDTLAKMFLDDLQMEANLIDRLRSNAYNDFTTSTGYAQQLYDTKAGYSTDRFNKSTGVENNIWEKGYTTDTAKYGATADYANNRYNYTNNLINTNYDKWAAAEDSFFNKRYQTNSDHFQNLVAAQAASYTPANYAMQYGQQLANAGQNLYNTMYSGRMGTGSTTTTKSDDSGMWSALGTLGAVGIKACFTGDTLITTPTGYKYIKDIKEGDEVLSIKNGEIVTKKVASVNEPKEQNIVDVYWDNGRWWHTTGAQRYFDGTHFSWFDGDNEKGAVAFHGGMTFPHIINQNMRRDTVYDFTLEGDPWEDIFFANDVAAEGYGE